MRLLLDEHYSREIAVRLREEGHDVVTVSERGLTGLDDESLLRFAASERRALLANNVRHFAPLARRWASSGDDHYGLLFTSDASMPRGKATIGRYIEILHALLEERTADDALDNQLRWLP